MRVSSSARLGDRVFSAGTAAAAVAVLAALAGVAAFLTWRSIPAFTAAPGSLPDGARDFASYAGPLVFGTLWAAALALLFAAPVAIGVALAITHYAPRRLAGFAAGLIDTLAAVPSVVFGLWGIAVLAPALQPLYARLSSTLGWIPLFAGPVSGTGRTILTAALVLAVMILPIITALCREVIAQTPAGRREAALALGATRWEMIRMAVLPSARGGIVSAIMLGLGRALGETMAVAMVLSPARVVDFLLLTAQNPNTIAANIALQFPEASGVGLSALIATGLVLFAITVAVNALARVLMRRRTPMRRRAA